MRATEVAKSVEFGMSGCFLLALGALGAPERVFHACCLLRLAVPWAQQGARAGLRFLPAPHISGSVRASRAAGWGLGCAGMWQMLLGAC